MLGVGLRLVTLSILRRTGQVQHELLLTTGNYLLLESGGRFLLSTSPPPRAPTASTAWDDQPLTWGTNNYITWG
jgi:hypothetical protein